MVLPLVQNQPSNFLVNVQEDYLPGKSTSYHNQLATITASHGTTGGKPSVHIKANLKGNCEIQVRISYQVVSLTIYLNRKNRGGDACVIVDAILEEYDPPVVWRQLPGGIDFCIVTNAVEVAE